MNRSEAVARATEIQREASRPDRSAAVRASAGSGKTRVLVDRFVRLCVEGEHNDVHPRAILAITFTRKAATEIRERLLERARTLALAGDDERRALLADLFADRTPLPAEEDRAARLYERLLEDPSGLQVGTIHSFCQRILARFATEAGLDPHAGLIEDRDDLLDEALDLLMAETAADPQPGGAGRRAGQRPHLGAAQAAPGVRRADARRPVAAPGRSRRRHRGRAPHAAGAGVAGGAAGRSCSGRTIPETACLRRTRRRSWRSPWPSSPSAAWPG